jgi:hypothetical protein
MRLAAKRTAYDASLMRARHVMEWNPQQLVELYANVYGRRRQCPTCGGALTLTPSSEADEVGVVECSACDARHLISQHNDPLRATFREFTAEENKQILATERACRTPICPVDGTAMDVHAQRSLGLNSNTLIWCRRCGRKARYVRLYG